MTAPRDDASRLAAIFDALAERAAGASDQEILEDAAAAKVDLAADGSRVRAVLAEGVLRTKKSRLLAAGEQHKRSVAALGQRATRLPESPAKRRDLLDRIIRRKPEMRQQVLTLQNREFEKFTANDVDSALRQLDALGLLDDELAGDD